MSTVSGTNHPLEVPVSIEYGWSLDGQFRLDSQLLAGEIYLTL